MRPDIRKTYKQIISMLLSFAMVIGSIYISGKNRADAAEDGGSYTLTVTEVLELSASDEFQDDNGNTIRSDGVFWKANFNYNRVMLANCSRELFLSAISGKDKDTELKKAVFTDSLIADAVPDGEKIMEIRFPRTSPSTG